MSLKSFLAGIIATLAILLIGAYVFVASGGMPVPTKSPPLPLEATIAKMSIRHALRGERSKPSPIEISEEHLLSGAKLYVPNCAQCHGLPGQPKTPTAKGMFPDPPQLFEQNDGVEDDPIGQTYWVVKNGIRLTGMPGFVDSLSDEQLWEVSLLLHKASSLPDKVLKILLPQKKAEAL